MEVLQHLDWSLQRNHVETESFSASIEPEGGANLPCLMV
jgi:hypothetical protein